MEILSQAKDGAPDALVRVEHGGLGDEAHPLSAVQRVHGDLAHLHRDRKVENFPDSSIYRAKTFRTGKKCVNQIFAIKMCVNYNFAPKRWFNSRFICLSIWKPATKLSDSLF